MTDYTYFEQLVPVAMNCTKQITDSPSNKDFIASNTRSAQGLLWSYDSFVQKVFLHVLGVAVNTYAGSNALDCTTASHNQWQINLNGGSYSDLVNGTNPDGQMLDDDWRCPVEGATHSFHLMFDITSQLTDIDGNIGLRLQNAKAEQSSLYVTVYVFLRILWYH